MEYEEIYIQLKALTDTLFMISDGLARENERAGNAVLVVASVQQDLLNKYHRLIYEDK